MDILSLVLTLTPQPLTQPHSEPLPAWWGRAARALLLEVVSSADENLAANLQDEQNLRPYTVSTLRGSFPRAQGSNLPAGTFLPNRPYTLRFTSLSAAVSQILWQAVQPGGMLAPGSQVELDHLPFCVQAAVLSPEEDLWAASDDYSSLAAARLVGAEPPPRQVTLAFASPTTFHSQQRIIPLPLPELVFGSLLDRWNAFAPIAFPPELRRYAQECLTIKRYELKSRAVSLQKDNFRIGAVGQVTYSTLNFDHYWMSLVHTLAAFALYSGVGAGVTQGLGQCQKI
ncbi:MAG TPA: CRISPR system precrRNA processing endoribonuclease RAMP protein Cas6 [Anaerolineaceae bacterium]